MRQLTLSTDKDKYGIRLRAEPDHMVLGKRLKGAFKSVTASIKELTSEQLEAFQKTGVCVCVLLLHTCVLYTSSNTHQRSIINDAVYQVIAEELKVSVGIMCQNAANCVKIIFISPKTQP